MKQEAITVACTRGFDFVAQFSCKQSKLLQSTSRIFNALCCGAIKLQAIFIIHLVVAEVILRWRGGGRGLNSVSRLFIRASTQVKVG